MKKNRFTKQKLHHENPLEEMQRIREQMMEVQYKHIEKFLEYKLGYWAIMPHFLIKWIFKIESFDDGVLRKIWILKKFGKEIARVEISGEIKR